MLFLTSLAKIFLLPILSLYFILMFNALEVSAAFLLSYTFTNLKKISLDTDLFAFKNVTYSNFHVKSTIHVQA